MNPLWASSKAGKETWRETRSRTEREGGLQAYQERGRRSEAGSWAHEGHTERYREENIERQQPLRQQSTQRKLQWHSEPKAGYRLSPGL